jgi:hypothetical protein
MADNNKKDGRDFILLGPRNGDGSIVCMRHKADHTTQIGMIAPVKDGEPIRPGQQIVQLTQGDGPGLDVEVIYGGESEEMHSAPFETSHKGPAMVTTPEFRKNYDRIFGTKPVVGSA